MAVGEQPRKALPLIAGQPTVERIGIAGFEQALLGDSMGREASGDFEQGGTAFAHIRPRIVIAVGEQLLALLDGEC
jgi:hypothetical protein